MYGDRTFPKIPFTHLLFLISIGIFMNIRKSLQCLIWVSFSKRTHGFASAQLTPKYWMRKNYAFLHMTSEINSHNHFNYPRQLTFLHPFCSLESWSFVVYHSSPRNFIFLLTAEIMHNSTDIVSLIFTGSWINRQGSVHVNHPAMSIRLYCNTQHVVL